MELCYKWLTARSAVILLLMFMGNFAFLWASPVFAFNPQSDKDYLLPEQTKGGFISQPSSLESTGSAAKTSSISSYTAFDGSTHQLLENRGRYVNVLIPQSYDDGAFFTADHIEEMVDRLDMLYVLYSEIMQDQPAGNDLLTIAFVPQTCGMACGLVGAKGFEILSDPRNYEAIIGELDAGRLERILLHEMAHNFDLRSALLHYLPDHAHAWTDMFEFFALFRYSRSGSRDEAPDDLYNSPVSSVWKVYVTNESANWQHCVIEDGCADMGLSANNLWAMLYYRIEALYGIDAILESFDYLRDYASTSRPPSSIEEKEGVRTLSLAMGAGVNIACYLDDLKWPITAELRAELNQTFGSNNALCADLDGDGYSAINGDCDDTNASRNIGMAEIGSNGIDDDCDKMIDEPGLVESDAGNSADNFVAPVKTAIPFEVKASSSNPDDRDSFSFSLPSSQRVWVTLCASTGFRGWVAAQQADGSFIEDANWYSYQAQPGCTSNTFDFGDATKGGLVVIADESEGEYSLVVSQAAELIPDFSSNLQVSANPSGGMTLQISDDNGLFSNLVADEIEVWISGAGVQLFEPFAIDTTIELNNITAPALKNGETYQVRARPRGNGLPLADFSAGHLFRYDRASANLPSVDHRFNGAWFDTSHDGEGFIIEVLEDERVVIYWFTYQQDGSQRWMLGTGEIEDNIIRTDALMDASGGRFGADFDPDDVILKNVGSLTISFLDCSTALVNYSVDGNGDHQNTTRLTHVYGHGCTNETPTPAIDISGSWFDPSHNGEGFIIEQLSDDSALVFWFTYNDEGKQSWMFNSGAIDNGRIRIPQLRQPSGGQFGRSYNPDSVTNHQWGGLTLDLDCNGGTASYTTQSEGYSNGSQSLVRLTNLSNSGCP
jgi:hypothetical protein